LRYNRLWRLRLDAIEKRWSSELRSRSGVGATVVRERRGWRSSGSPQDRSLIPTVASAARRSRRASWFSSTRSRAWCQAVVASSNPRRRRLAAWNQAPQACGQLAGVPAGPDAAAFIAEYEVVSRPMSRGSCLVRRAAAPSGQRPKIAAGGGRPTAGLQLNLGVLTRVEPRQPAYQAAQALRQAQGSG
jgi:hypothetical protein